MGGYRRLARAYLLGPPPVRGFSESRLRVSRNSPASGTLSLWRRGMVAGDQNGDGGRGSGMGMVAGEWNGRKGRWGIGGRVA